MASGQHHSLFGLLGRLAARAVSSSATSSSVAAHGDTAQLLLRAGNASSVVAGLGAPCQLQCRRGILSHAHLLRQAGAGGGNACRGLVSPSASTPAGGARAWSRLWEGLQRRCKSTLAADAAAAETVAGGASSSGSGAAAAAYGGLAAGLGDGARRQMAWWLGGTAAWVYSMVVLGGVTRLTRSGLSMTDWKFTGEARPQTQEEWEAEFARYKESPEFKRVHSTMTLDGFKFIYYMEYAHRMWGRILGLAFVLPATYFAARGAITWPLARRLGLLLFMGGTQGLVGWWMVRSGLVEPEHEWSTPRVSPYRLAAHLVSAFAIYATLVWSCLDLAYPSPATASAAGAFVRGSAAVRGPLLPLAALIAVTATSGAFVAGLDAGRAYNTFPLMAGELVPSEYWSHGSGLRNLLENTAAVQFNHRALATATATAVLGFWAWARRQGLHPRARLALDLMAGVTALQYALGIYTLLEYVPVHLGSLHQANALNLFTAVLMAAHAVRPPQQGPLGSLVGALAAPAAVAAIATVAVSVTTNK